MKYKLSASTSLGIKNHVSWRREKVSVDSYHLTVFQAFFEALLIQTVR